MTALASMVDVGEILEAVYFEGEDWYSLLTS